MKLIKLSAIDSTNHYLKQLSKVSELEDGTTVVAYDQTRGKGQQGASWFSEPGKSLTFSVFKRFSDFDLEKQAMVNWVVSLALKKSLISQGIENISVKWPNDIMAGSGKLAGILIENQTRKRKILSTVIGIGMNVNNHEFPELVNAISLRMHTGKEFDLNQLLSSIRDTLLSELDQLDAMSSSTLKAQYENELFRRDQVSVFENAEGQKWNGIIRGVTDDGKLQVETESEEILMFGLKEIRLLN